MKKKDEWEALSVDEKLDALRAMTSHMIQTFEVKWAAMDAWMKDYDKKYDKLRLEEKTRCDLLGPDGSYL